MNSDVTDPFSAFKTEKTDDVFKKFVRTEHDINKRRSPAENKAGKSAKGNCNGPKEKNVNKHCGFGVAAAAENSHNILTNETTSCIIRMLSPYGHRAASVIFFITGFYWRYTLCIRF